MERKQAGQHDRLGKYELLERLGQGGMGEVWKARDTQLQRYVAIKLLRTDLQDDADFSAYFMREARLVAALHHPNIVQIHDFRLAETQGERVQAYMVMDYVEGGTLAGAIQGTVRKGVFWPASEIVDLFTAISLALDYAHQRGMIHRDIKPANILLDHSLSSRHALGVPILTDFGIARWHGGDSTVTGFVGTPLYISPEQAQSGPVDARSDLYSLGIVLYEVLTGVTPFRGDNPLGIMLQHIDSQPPPPARLNPQISPALSAVTLKSIAKDPRERFPSATAMTRALAQAFNLPVPALLDGPREKRDLSTDYNPLQPYPGIASVAPSSNEVNRMTPGAAEQARLTPTAFSSAPPQPSGFPYHSGGPAPSSQEWQPVGVQGPSGVAATPLPLQPNPRRRSGPFSRKWVLSVSLGCVILLLLGLGAAVVGPRLLHSSGAATQTAVGGVAGQLLFLSTSSAAKGIFNEVQIDVTGVQPPPAGQVYYAWLTQANSEALMVPHWSLQVNQGTIHDVYTSVPPQTDLLSSSRLLLITAEDANSPPVVQSPSPAQHYYYAPITHSSTTSPTFVIRSCPTSNINSASNPCR